MKFVPVPKHHAMKTYGESPSELHAYSASSLDGERSASYTGRFTPRKETAVPI
jgi:hypothetical protein